jgi:hypothetical protein
MFESLRVLLCRRIGLEEEISRMRKKKDPGISKLLDILNDDRPYYPGKKH